VARDPKKYDHRIVRVEAVFKSGGEITSLYSPGCPSRDLISWVDFSRSLRGITAHDLLGKMDRILATDGRVRLLVSIEFFGPKPVKIPPGTSPEAADIMLGTDARWGHMNQFVSRVRFLRIFRVDPVPSDVSWPQ
jgi:hypothetical protein